MLLKTDEFIINMDRPQVTHALSEIQRAADYCGFGNKTSEKIRLISEEMILSTDFVLNKFDGKMWAETNKDKFEVHLAIEGLFTNDEKKELTSYKNSNGKDVYKKSFFSKIGDIITENLAADNMPLDLSMHSELYASSTVNPDIMAFRTTYMSEYYKNYEPERETDEYSEIEKKIISKIADDVIVRAKTGFVEIVAIINMPE